jgi:hypothetical protein
MAWFLIQLALSVQVQGSTACPLPAEVQARLAELLPAKGLDSRVGFDVAELAVEDNALVLSLRSADGSLVSRRLPRGHACEELAAAAAVAIAAWQSDVHPAYAAPPPASAPVVPGLAKNADLRPVATSPRVALEVGLQAGALSSLSAGGVAPTWVAHASVARARHWLRLRLAGLWQSSREQAVGDGQAVWQRLGAGFGLEYRKRSMGAWWSSAAVSLLAAHLTVKGRDFGQNRQERTWEPGVEVALTLGRKIVARGLSVLGGLTATAWPRPHDAQAPDGTSATLPRLDLLLGVGLSWQSP